MKDFFVSKKFPSIYYQYAAYIQSLWALSKSMNFEKNCTKLFLSEVKVMTFLCSVFYVCH